MYGFIVIFTSARTTRQRKVTANKANTFNDEYCELDFQKGFADTLLITYPRLPDKEVFIFLEISR